VDHAPVATNCFDPDLIRLDATFHAPFGPGFDGSGVLVSGIFADGDERRRRWLSPVGSPQWRIRFTPAEPGDYKLSLNIETNGVSAGRPITTHVQRCPVPRRPDSTAMCAWRRTSGTSRRPMAGRCGWLVKTCAGRSIR